jgi:hypothetical protein
MPHIHNSSEFLQQFNELSTRIRIVAILSPDCQICLKDFKHLKNIHDRFDSSKLFDFSVWSPSPNLGSEIDSRDEIPNIALFSDENLETLARFSKVLNVENKNTHFFLLYAPRIMWETEGTPPEPTFFMKHVSSSDKAEPNQEFNEDRFCEEIRFLLESEDPESSEQELTEILLKKKKS